MTNKNEIVLRPRFKFDVNYNNESLLELFDEAKTTQKDFIVSRIDDHVFIKFPKIKQHFWSPQLHLEINKNFDDDEKSTIYGLFGPNPTVWTMFMFFHFLVAIIFIGFGCWAYSNWSLDDSYGVQIGIMVMMVLIWFVLYFAGRMGKRTGMGQMHELHHFVRDTLRSKDIHGLN